MLMAGSQIQSSYEQKFFENRIDREWLSTKEAAQFLSVSENALRIMVYREQIPAFKIGRRLRFKLKDCESLFERKRD
jgi:excisionase family DNA binding protein